ncbi:hypothetical protein Tco_1264421 [Tanacetum coccineum]
MTAIFHDMVEDFMEVFMDDFLVFDNSSDCCLANLDRMLARWHKISGAVIEVDRAKIDVIAKFPYPTNVKGVRSFLGHAGFYRRLKIKRAENLAADHFSRLKNPDLGTFTKDEIVDEFPDEHLMILKVEVNDEEPWYADYVNYIVGKIVPSKWTPKKEEGFSLK